MFVLGDNFFIRQLVNYSQVVNLPNLKNINFLSSACLFDNNNHLCTKYIKTDNDITADGIYSGGVSPPPLCKGRGAMRCHSTNLKRNDSET